MCDSARSSRAYLTVRKRGDSMNADLLLRYLIIAIALQLACAWIKEFGTPWPLVDAFELAESAEDQLFKSLGISFASLAIPLAFYARLVTVSVHGAFACASSRGARSAPVSYRTASAFSIALQIALSPLAAPRGSAGPWCSSRAFPAPSQYRSA